MPKHQPIERPLPVLLFVVRFIILCVSKVCWRIKFLNIENIPPESGSGLLVVANHQTYLDPFWIALPIKRDLRFMAWDEAFDWFFVGWLIRHLGAFPVNTKFGSRKSYTQSVKFLKQGKTMVLFPEAAREFTDGKFLPFKSGAAKLALHSKVSILPVTVRGANKVWGRGIKYPRSGKIEIIYHPVLEFENFGNETSPEVLTEKFQEIIRNDSDSKR